MYPRTLSTWVTIRYFMPAKHYFRSVAVRLHYNADLPIASQSELLEQTVLDKAPTTGTFEHWNRAEVYEGMDSKSLRLLYTYYRPGSARIEWVNGGEVGSDDGISYTFPIEVKGVSQDERDE